MSLEIFTDSLCSKPPPPNLYILWCKVLFFQTWISVVFSTVLKKIKTINFQFFSHSWSLKCRTFLRMAQLQRKLHTLYKRTTKNVIVTSLELRCSVATKG